MKNILKAQISIFHYKVIQENKFLEFFPFIAIFSWQPFR